MRWRLELSIYDFDVVYRAGKENIPADTFSRVRAMSLTLNNLSELHQSLCHPGVTRMAHFVKRRNLPFSIEEIKRITESCKTCSECKPQYYHPGTLHLIKATQPFERLSLDFKGPLPTNNQNKFMLTIIDEYSRFPFCFLMQGCQCAMPVILHLWHGGLYPLRQRFWLHEYTAQRLSTPERNFIQSNHTV